MLNMTALTYLSVNGMIQIRIGHLKSGSPCIKGTAGKSTLSKDSLPVPLMHNDPSDLTSLILIKVKITNASHDNTS